MKERAIVAIVAGFPCIIERIPCLFVINKGGNIQHLTNPIICHIYVGICIIHEGNHLTHKIIPRLLHFWWKWKDFAHESKLANFEGSAKIVWHLSNWSGSRFAVSLTFQKFRVILFNFFHQFFIGILIITLHHVTIKNWPHSFEVHSLNHVIDKLLLKFSAVHNT